MRGCWRPNINFIFWSHCYDRHVVSFLFSWCWGQLHRGFPRAPSVGCGLPYHISSLTLWKSAGNCIGGFRGPPRSGVAFPTTLVSTLLGVCWQLLGNQVCFAFHCFSLFSLFIYISTFMWFRVILSKVRGWTLCSYEFRFNNYNEHTIIWFPIIIYIW